MTPDLHDSYALALILSWGVSWPAALAAIASGQIPRTIPKALVVPAWLGVAAAATNWQPLWVLVSVVTGVLAVAGVRNARAGIQGATVTVPSAITICWGLLLVTGSAISMVVAPGAMALSALVLNLGILTMFAARFVGQFAAFGGAVMSGLLALVALVALIVPGSAGVFLAAVAAALLSVGLVFLAKTHEATQRIQVLSSVALVCGVAGAIAALCSFAQVGVYCLAAWAVVTCLTWMRIDRDLLAGPAESTSGGKDCSGCCGCASKLKTGDDTVDTKSACSKP